MVVFHFIADNTQSSSGQQREARELVSLMHGMPIGDSNPPKVDMVEPFITGQVDSDVMGAGQQDDAEDVNLDSKTGLPNFHRQQSEISPPSPRPLMRFYSVQNPTAINSGRFVFYLCVSSNTLLKVHPPSAPPPSPPASPPMA